MMIVYHRENGKTRYLVGVANRRPLKFIWSDRREDATDFDMTEAVKHLNSLSGPSGLVNKHREPPGTYGVSGV